jgi:hypothetical protein
VDSAQSDNRIAMMLSFLLSFSLFQSLSPNPCTWTTARQIGTLEAVVNESSGMAISRRIPNRAYRINDSGDSGRFFSLDLAGGGTKIVKIQGFNPVDTEDMAIGPCGASTVAPGDCIFIADIGDNSRQRRFVELIIVEERADFPAEVPATYRVLMLYPDGPHDAEALGVHPDGTVYIATKDARRSQIFKLKREQWRSSENTRAVLEPVVTLDWPALRPNTLPFAGLVTAMDIAPDGKSFVLLNYVDAVEFFVDLSAEGLDPTKWKSGKDYRTIQLTTLEQEEAIGYLPDGRSLLYDTERPPNATTARIMRMDCR